MACAFFVMTKLFPVVMSAIRRRNRLRAWLTESLDHGRLALMDDVPDRSDIHPHTHATNVAYRPKAAGKLSQGQLTRLRITAFMVIPGFLDTDTPQRNTQSLRRHPRLSIKLGAF